MKHYIALLGGPGEGCGYTIGCNVAWEVVVAKSEDQAKDRVLDMYGELGGSDLPRIEEIILYEITPGSSVVFSNLAERSKKLYEDMKSGEEERKEREEYERLKKKYGDG